MGFRKYFLEQADFADDAHARGFRINCQVVATASLDALAAIWESDFPEEAASRAKEFGGKTPASARMARFVRQFTGDRRADNVAVIRLAEDALPHATSRAKAELTALLAERTPKLPGELPPAHLDLSLAALVAKAPQVFAGAPARLLGVDLIVTPAGGAPWGLWGASG